VGALARFFGMSGPSDPGGPVAVLQGLGKRGRGFSGLTELGPTTRAAASKKVNGLIYSCTPGMHQDDHWAPIACIRKRLTKVGYDFSISNARYEHDRRGTPVGKRWDLEVGFTTKAGKPATLNGTIVASGAGSVRDPLRVYDVTAYVG